MHLIASASALVVEIVDTGRGVADTEPDGNGLRGMRERAAALGGRFEAGNHPDGGFRVSAWLPCHPA